MKGDRWDADQCRECVPEALPENEDAVTIYLLTRDQLIMGWNGPIAINQVAVHAAMDLYEVENRKDCFEKVLKLSHHFLAEMREAQG